VLVITHGHVIWNVTVNCCSLKVKQVWLILFILAPFYEFVELGVIGLSD
jgi:hypothetical protein